MKVWLVLFGGFATPNDKHAAHQSACMSDARSGNLARGFQQGSRKFSGRDEVNVVPVLFAYETTEEEKLARCCGSGRKRRPISRKG